MKPKTKISGHKNMAKLKEPPVGESTSLEETIIADPSQRMEETDEGEKPDETSNQVEKFFEINESFIFGDVPENENSLGTFLIASPSKNEDDSNLDEDNFDKTKPILNFQKPIGSQIYCSSKGYSKLSKVDEVKNPNTLNPDTKSDNEESREYSKLSNMSNQIENNSQHTDSKIKRSNKGYSKLPNVSNEIIEKINTQCTDSKNERSDKGYSKLPNVSNEIIEKTNTQNTDSKNKRSNKGYSKIPNVSNEIIQNTNILHTNIKNSGKDDKGCSKLSKLSDEMIKKTSILSAGIKNYKKGITVNSTSVLSQNISNAVISQDESVSYSAVTAHVENSQSIETAPENDLNTSKTRVFLVRFPGKQQALKTNKESIDSKLTQIIKTVTKCEDPAAIASTSSTSYEEISLQSISKNTSIKEGKKKNSTDSFSKIQTQTDSSTAEAIRKMGIMQPRVSLADFLGNREVFINELKDKKDLSYLNKIYNSTELNKCININTEDSHKLKEIIDDSKSCAGNKRPLKRSFRLKNIKDFKEKPLLDDKVLKLSHHVKNNESIVTRLEKNSPQDINNNDNFNVLLHPDKKSDRNSLNFHKIKDNTRKNISEYNPSLVLKQTSNEIDIPEGPFLPEGDLEENNSELNLTRPKSIKRSSDISGLPTVVNGTVNKYKYSDISSSPSGRKQLSLMDMFKRCSEKVNITPESDVSTLSDSFKNVTKSSENVTNMSKTLLPKYSGVLNDEKIMCSDLLMTNTPKSTKCVDSMCLNLSPNKESQKRGKSLTTTPESRSSSRKRSFKSSVNQDTILHIDNAACGIPNKRCKKDVCTTEDVTKSKSSGKGHRSDLSLAVPFNFTNNSANNTILTDTESSNKQSQNSKKKTRNTISVLLSRMQTRTISSFQNSEKILPRNRKTSNMEYCSTVQNKDESPLKKKISLSAHVVSHSLQTEKETIASKTGKKFHNKRNTNSSSYDSTIESVVSAMRRKRSASVEPKRFSLHDSEELKSPCFVSDSSGADGETATRKRNSRRVHNKVNQNSSFDLSTESTLQVKKRKRSASVEPKSHLHHDVETMSNEVTEPYGKRKQEYSPKNRYLKRGKSLNPESALNSSIDADLEENNIRGTKKHTSTSRNKMSTIKIQQVCSQNTDIFNHSVLPEQLNEIDGQNEEDGSNSETDSPEMEAPDAYAASEITPNEQTGYQYFSTAGQTTSTPLLNTGNNALVFRNPVLHLPPHMNGRGFPYVYNLPNPFGNVAPYIYSFPCYHVRPPLLQTSNLPFNNASNTNTSLQSGATEPNVANLSNIATGNDKGPLMIGKFTGTITAHKNTISSIIVHKGHKGIKKFNEARKNIVQDIRKKCYFDIQEFSSNFFSENPSLSLLTVREFYSKPLVLNSLKKKICEQVPDFDVPPKVEYVFENTYFESPIREVMKDYVDFHMQALYKAPASKQYFVKRAFKKFPFRDCTYLCEAFPKDDDGEYTHKDLVCYLSCAALLAILDECKKRKLLA